MSRLAADLRRFRQMEPLKSLLCLVRGRVCVSLRWGAPSSVFLHDEAGVVWCSDSSRNCGAGALARRLRPETKIGLHGDGQAVTTLPTMF